MKKSFKLYIIITNLLFLGIPTLGNCMLTGEEEARIRPAVIRCEIGEDKEEGDINLLKEGANKNDPSCQLHYGQHLLHRTKEWEGGARLLIQAAQQEANGARELVISVIKREIPETLEEGVRLFCQEWPKIQLDDMKVFSPTTAAHVGWYFLKKDHGNRERDLTNLKLSRLCYFAQGCYAAIHTAPLFKEDFEARELGPVLPTLYEDYRHFGDTTIILPQHELVRESPIQDPSLLSFLDAIYEQVGRFAAPYLAAEVQKAPSPWSQIWDEGRGANQQIPLYSMYAYFKTREITHAIQARRAFLELTEEAHSRESTPPLGSPEKRAKKEDEDTNGD